MSSHLHSRNCFMTSLALWTNCKYCWSVGGYGPHSTYMLSWQSIFPKFFLSNKSFCLWSRLLLWWRDINSLHDSDVFVSDSSIFIASSLCIKFLYIVCGLYSSCTVPFLQTCNCLFLCVLLFWLRVLISSIVNAILYPLCVLQLFTRILG